MSNNWKLPYYATRTEAATAVASEFPGGTLGTFDLVNKSTDNAAATTAGTVPSASPYRVELPVLLDQVVVTCTIGGASRPIVRGETAGVGEVAIAANGWVTFNAADAGLAYSFGGWQPYATSLSAGFMMYLIEHIRALETEANASRPSHMLYCMLPGVNSSATASGRNVELIVPGQAASLWKVVSAKIVKCEPGGTNYTTGTTTVRVDTADVAGTASGNEIDCTVAQNGHSGSAGTGTLNVTAGDTLYVGIPAASANKHKDIQIQIELQRRNS